MKLPMIIQSFIDEQTYCGWKMYSCQKVEKGWKLSFWQEEKNIPECGDTEFYPEYSDEPKPIQIEAMEVATRKYSVIVRG
jgi:hypothetical protein